MDAAISFSAPGRTRTALAIAFGASIVLATPAAAQPVVPFEPGMIVTRSVRVAPGLYPAPAPEDTERALIVVRGDDVVLDLTGVRLHGTEPEADPDLARGVAIRVDGGENVTVRGGVVRGYRIAILARGVRDLRIVDNDLSHNWKPRLYSGVGHESLVDWLSFHDNENREWMRFGAAIYLEDVVGGEIRGNVAVQGMNGFLLTRTDSVVVRDNDASYNSGLGVGLYRSSHNVIVRNRFDYDVRGYSEGFYQRGQDSAGLLLYEQSMDNVVAYNSATHSGDGFFLWAGNQTMETGEGGANDNLLFHNDFSWAPTNAVEVTFSRNRIIANHLEGSRYGVWGGYSWETEIRGNCFGGNRYGVAIEHGQDNRIVGNLFDGDSLAISLWARPSQPADWGYPRHRDVRSRDHQVSENVFRNVAERWRLENTEGHSFLGNVVEEESAETACDPRLLLGAAFDSLAPDLPGVPRQIPRGPRAFLPRSAIVVDEWGPYDGRSPRLHPIDTTRLEVPLRILGPPGAWRIVDRVGVERVSGEAGPVGDTLSVVPEPGRWRDWSVELEYVGEATVSPRGTESAAGRAVAFGFRRFEPIGPWTVSFHVWTDPGDDPLADPAGFEARLAGEPRMVREEDRLDYQWYAPPLDGLPRERWALEAVATMDLPGDGPYTLRTISDDAIRVWVDGALVIDRWDPHGSTVDHVAVASGRHEIRVRHYQLDGWTELRVEVVEGDQASPGSPGPH